MESIIHCNVEDPCWGVFLPCMCLCKVMPAVCQKYMSPITTATVPWHTCDLELMQGRLSILCIHWICIMSLVHSPDQTSRNDRKKTVHLSTNCSVLLQVIECQPMTQIMKYSQHQQSYWGPFLFHIYLCLQTYSGTSSPPLPLQPLSEILGSTVRTFSETLDKTLLSAMDWICSSDTKWTIWGKLSLWFQFHHHSTLAHPCPPGIS